MLGTVNLGLLMAFLREKEEKFGSKEFKKHFKNQLLHSQHCSAEAVFLRILSLVLSLWHFSVGWRSLSCNRGGDGIEMHVCCDTAALDAHPP